MREKLALQATKIYMYIYIQARGNGKWEMEMPSTHSAKKGDKSSAASGVCAGVTIAGCYVVKCCSCHFTLG